MNPLIILFLSSDWWYHSAKHVDENHNTDNLSYAVKYYTEVSDRHLFITRSQILFNIFHRMPIKITLHILQKNEKKSFRLHSFSLITVNLVTNTQCRTHNIRSLKIFTFGVWIFSFRSGPDKQSSVKITNFRNNQKAKISMFQYKQLLKIPGIHDVQLLFSINCGREGQQWV